MTRREASALVGRVFAGDGLTLGLVQSRLEKELRGNCPDCGGSGEVASTHIMGPEWLMCDECGGAGECEHPALSLARQAVNGWACHAKTARELEEIGRIHSRLNEIKK
jgi:transcription elongation factor Elf1